MRCSGFKRHVTGSWLIGFSRRRIRLVIDLAVGMTINQIAMGIAFITLARLAGPRETGLVAAFVGAFTVLTDIVDAGTSLWLQREISADRNTQSASARQVFSNKVWIASTVALIAFLLIYTTQSSASLLWLPLWFFLTAVAQTVVSIHSGLGHFRLVGGLAALDKSLALATMLVTYTVVGEPVATGFCIGLASGAAAQLAVSIALLGDKRSIGLSFRLRYADFNGHRSFAMSAVFSDLQLADTAIIAGTAGSYTAGLFAVPARLSGPLGIIPTAMARVLLTAATAANADTRLIMRRLPRLVPVLLLTYAVIGTAAWYVVVPIFGDSYKAARTATVVVCISTGLAAYNQLAATVLQAQRAERLVAFVVSFAMVLQLIGLAVVPHFFGVSGAAAVYLTMQTVIGLALYLRLRREPLHGGATYNADPSG